MFCKSEDKTVNFFAVGWEFFDWRVNGLMESVFISDYLDVLLIQLISRLYPN